ncbi:PAS domain-containing protein [Hydrogenophaga sp.]|uniref:PAS domain-containing protein n=1 Tax=Hydrogenophaga sp. TaxID=1904254 RepID=UPI0035AE6784
MRNAKDFGPFLRIVFAYLAASLLWVLLSDQAVNKLLPLSYVAAAQTWKGWFFVSVTTVLLYVLLRRVHRQMREAAERELGAVQREARSALLLRNLVDSSGDAIFAKDPEGRYLVFNRAAEQLSGKVADEVLGRDDTVVFPADEAAKLRANDQYVMGQAEPVESEDGSVAAAGRHEHAGDGRHRPDPQTGEAAVRRHVAAAGRGRPPVDRGGRATGARTRTAHTGSSAQAVAG